MKGAAIVSGSEKSIRVRSGKRARKALAMLASATTLAVNVIPLRAADLYWDSDGSSAGNSTDGAGLGGTGTWDTSTANWWDLTSDIAWPNTNADRAIFTRSFAVPTAPPTLNTVTLDAGGVTANILQFNRSDFVIASETLTLAGTTAGAHIQMGESATISSVVTGTDGLTKTGGGSLRLTNAGNNYTGTVNIRNGTLILSDPAALGGTGVVNVIGGNPANPGNATNFRGMTNGALMLDGSTSGFTLSRDLSLQGQGPLATSGAALVNVGNNDLSGTITTAPVAAGTTTNINTRITSAVGTLTLSGTLNVQGTAGTTITTLGGVNQAGSSAYNLTGALSGSGTLEKSGGGTLFLNPSTTSGFSGTLRVSSAGANQSSVRISTALDGANATSVFGTANGATSSAPIDMNGGVLELRSDTDLNFEKNVYQRASSTFFAGPAAGSDGINGTVTFGAFRLEANQTTTFNSRNGYNVTFGAWTQNSSTNNTTITNAMGGELTFSGNAWNNSDSSARALTVQTAGSLTITGSINTSGAGTKTLTKEGIGLLTIQGTATALNGSVTIDNGAVAITDFRSLNNNAQTINISSNSSNTGLNNSNNNGPGALIIGTSATPTAEGLTTSKVINLAGTTNGATIHANQTGVNPVIFNAAFNAGGAGVKTLTLGGTSIADNSINGAIVDNSTTNTTSLSKVGGGTWVLAGTNAYTGTTTISNGVLKLKANAESSTVLANTSGIVFNQVNQFAGGTLEFVGQNGADNVQTLGTLTPTLGANTLKLTPGAGGTASLVFGSLGTIGNGATVNIVGSDGTTNKVTLTDVATGLVAPHFHFGGNHFARSVDGVLAAPVYGTDATFVTSPGGTTLGTGQNNFNITGNITAQTATTVSTLRFDGSRTLTMSSGALTIRTAAAGTHGGILVTGGNATITGGTGITTGGAGALIIRVDGASDTLTLNSLLTSTTTGGITKSGAGTLILTAANNQTGTVTVNEGTVQLSGSGRFAASNAALSVRQGATVDLNGISPGTTTGAIINNGTVTNNHSSNFATLIVGGNNGTGTSLGIFAGKLNITKAGTGAQSWLGSSTYTGVTTIGSTGLVTVNTLADGDLPSGIGASSNAAGNLVFNGSTGGLVYQGNIVDGNLLTLGSRSASTDRLFTLAGTGARLSSTASNGNAIVWSNTGAIAHSGAAVARTLELTGTSTGDNTFNPKLTDSGSGTNVTSVTKTGAGQWNLGNSENTYTGATTINEGILGLNHNGAIHPNSPVVLTTTATTSVSILQMSGEFTRGLAATPAAGTGSITWGFTAASTTGGAGFAAHADPLVVAIGGTGTPTPLTWGLDGFVGTGGTQNLVLNSTTALSSVDFRNPINLGTSQRVISVLDNTSTGADFAIISGVLSGAGGGIQKIGGGILRLTGTNSYTGLTEVNAGTLVVNSLGHSTVAGGSSVGATGVTFNDLNAVTLGNSGTGAANLQYIGAGEVSDRWIRLNTTTGTTQLHADGYGAIVLTNVANDLVAGAKTLALRGTNADGNMITSALTDNGGALTVTIDSGATWILTNNSNSYTGNTNSNGGALGIGGTSVLGAGTLSLNNGTIFAHGQDRAVTNDVTQTSGATQGFTGDYSLTFEKPLTLLAAGGNNVLNNNIVEGKSLTFAGATANSLTTSNRTLTIDGTGELIIAGDFTTTRTTAVGLILLKTGSGALVLGGAGGNVNNFNRNNAAIDLDRGTIRLAASEVIGHGLDTQTTAVAYGGLTFTPEGGEGDVATFDLNGNTETINALTATTAATGAVVIDNTAATPATFRFGANNAAVNFGTGAGTYTITDSGAGALSIVKLGSAVATFPGNVVLTHQGTTSAEGGTFTLNANLNGTSGLAVRNSGTTMNVNGGITNPGGVTSVVVENGATLGLLDGTGNKLNGLTLLELGSASGSNTTLNFDVGDLSVAGDGLRTDTLSLATGGTLNLFAGNKITFNLNDAGLRPNTQYVLLDATAVSGGFLTGPLTISDYLLGTTPVGFTSLSLTAHSTTDQIILTTGNLLGGSLYWRGLTNTVWNGNVNNWSTDKAGATAATSVPVQGHDVVFAYNGASGTIATTLGQNFKINSLTFETGTTTPTAVTIGPGTVTTNRLEIAPSDPSKGIEIKSGGPAVTISAPFRLGADQTWTTANTLTLSTGGLQGEADVIKAGSGTVVISAAANATLFNPGLTTDFTVTAGNLEISNAAALGSTATNNAATVIVKTNGGFYSSISSGTVTIPITLDGGALSAAVANQTYSGTVNVNSNSIINMRTQNGTTTTVRGVTLSGVVGGSGNLTVESVTTATNGNRISGAFIVSNAANTWSGNLLFNSGTAEFTSDASPNFTANNVTFNTFGRLTISGVDATTLTRSGTLSYGANAVGEINIANTSAVPSADYGVDQAGAVTIGSGGTGATVRITLADAFSKYTISGGVTLNGNSSISVAGDAAGVATISGAITDGAASYTLALNNNAGTWAQTNRTLRLNGANSYDGATTIAAGTVIAGNASAFGTTGSGTSVTNGAHLQIANVDIGTEPLTLNGTGISSGGALTATGAAVAGGSVTLATGSSVGVASASDSLTLSGAVGGTGALTKVGSGNLTLSGTTANTWSGLTNILAGTVELNKTAGVNAIVGDGVSSKSISDVVVNGGTLRLLANDQLADSVYVSMSSGSFFLNGKSETIYHFENAGGTYSSGRGGALTVTDPIWSSGVNHILGPHDFGTGIVTPPPDQIAHEISGGLNMIHGGEGTGIAGSITVGSAFSILQFSGATPTLTVNGDKDYGNVATPGRLVLTGNVNVTAGAQATIAAGPSLLSFNESTFEMVVDPDQTNVVPGKMQLGSGNRTFTVGANASLTIFAVVEGAGGVNKAGDGRLTLAGTNTYNGPTSITAGTLVVTGSTVSATEAITNGTLAGTGAVHNAVNIGAGGSVRPGDPAGSITGTLTVNSLTMAESPNSILGVDIVGTTPGSGYDQIALPNSPGSTVTLTGASLSVKLGTLLSGEGTERFYIIENDSTVAGSVTGTFSSLIVEASPAFGVASTATLTDPVASSALPGGYEFTDQNNGFVYTLVYNVNSLTNDLTPGSGNDVVLTVVPEPGSVALAALAGLGLLSRRRRRA